MKLIPLSQGRFAKVDDEDFGFLNQWKWYFTTQGYAGRKDGRSIALMHRQLLVPAKGFMIDHRNSDKLDNRRFNLRLCSRAQNLMNRGKNKNNTSGFKGVRLHKQNKNWIAEIGIGRKRIYLGVFDSPEKAHNAYRAAAEKYHGDFAYHG